MHERAVQQAQQQDAEARPYIQEAAGSQHRPTSSPSWPTCATAAVITADEFEREKAKILA